MLIEPLTVVVIFPADLCWFLISFLTSLCSVCDMRPAGVMIFMKAATFGALLSLPSALFEQIYQTDKHFVLQSKTSRVLY